MDEKTPPVNRPSTGSYGKPKVRTTRRLTLHPPRAGRQFAAQIENSLFESRVRARLEGRAWDVADVMDVMRDEGIV